MAMSEEQKARQSARMKAYWSEKKDKELRGIQKLVAERTEKTPRWNMPIEYKVQLGLTEKRADALYLACRCSGKTPVQVIEALIDEEFNL